MTPFVLGALLAIAAPVAVVLLMERGEHRRDERVSAVAAARRRIHRRGALSLWLDRANERARTATLDSEHRRSELNARAASRKQLAKTIRAALPSGVWAVAIALLGALLWGLSLGNEVFIDTYGYAGIGYPVALAWALALLTTLGFSVLGLVIWDLLGATHLLPFLGDVRRRMRGALAVSGVLLVALAMTQLPGLVSHRSEPIAAQVRTLTQNVSVLTGTHADPLVVARTRRDLAAARNRLRSARYTDQRLAVAAAGLEVVTSFAAVWLGILLVSWTVSASGERARRKASRLELHRMRVEARVRSDLLDVVDAEGFTPEEMQEELSRRQRRLAAVPAEPPDEAPQATAASPPPPDAPPASPGSPPTSPPAPGAAQPCPPRTPHWRPAF